MAYRTQDVNSYCDECDEVSIGSCRRCERPFCVDHQPEDDHRCTSCEAHYLAIEPKTRPLPRTEAKIVAIRTQLVAAGGIVFALVVLASGYNLLGKFGSVALSLGYLLGYAAIRTLFVRKWGNPEVLDKRELVRIREEFLQERPDKLLTNGLPGNKNGANVV